MRYQDIQWEDEDASLHSKAVNQVDELSFAELLKEEKQAVGALEIRVGAQVTGVISVISDSSDSVLV